MTQATPTSVYRYYDADGRLIYVGITSRGMLRQNEHNAHAPWWRFVASQDVEHVDTREAALRRERALIERHRPPFNRQHNPDHESRNAEYLAHAEAADGPHTGPLRCEDYANPVECTGLSSINEHWCGRPDCPTCHEGWHRYSQGFDDGAENEQRYIADDFAALCAVEDEPIREAALAARAALTALVEAASDHYGILARPVQSVIPTDADILAVLDLHAEMRTEARTEDPTEVPF